MKTNYYKVKIEWTDKDETVEINGQDLITALYNYVSTVQLQSARTILGFILIANIIKN